MITNIPPRFIVIDDKKEHFEPIVEAFKEMGTSCNGVQYDEENRTHLNPVWLSLVRGLIFEMAEEFDELLDDEITTVTLTYTDDLIVPEIADREGIHILERAGNQLVLEYSCSVKEVKDYLSSYGLPRHPERISFEFSIHEDSENDNL